MIYTMEAKKREYRRRCADLCTDAIPGYRISVSRDNASPVYWFFVGHKLKLKGFWWKFYEFNSGVLVSTGKTRKAAIEIGLDIIEKRGGLSVCFANAQSIIEKYGKAN